MKRFEPASRDAIAARLADFVRHDPPIGDAPLKHAAVVITLVDSDRVPGSIAFLLTRRAPKLRAHAGQWALPGGRCDAGETAVDAALRELHEELGLALPHAQVLGVLDDYPTRSGYLMTPVIAWCDDAAALRPNPAEVASVHRFTLAEIHPSLFEFVRIRQSDRPVVRIPLGGRIVNAPTAALLYQFSELLDGRVTRVAHLEQPVVAWR